MLNAYRKAADSWLSERSHTVRQVQSEKEALQIAKAHATDLGEAQQVLQHVAQAIQQEAHTRIASIVSKCLRSVFDEPYQFKINFERKRGRTEAVLVFERKGLEVDPLEASGGGVVAVAAFALRLACLVLSQPQKRKLLVLDEPFGHLSAEYRPRVCQMLETLCQELKLQVLLVTHDPEFVTGTVVRL